MSHPYPRHIYGGNLYFGGGPGPVAPPAPATTPAAPAADTEAAKAKTSMQAKRRIGGVDTLQGGVLGAMAQQGKAKTLGASGSYTGEP